MRGVRDWIALGTLLFCGGCAGTDEQAVRHAVTAELIERYKVGEEQVHLARVERASASWLVRAELRPLGRGGARRLLTCRVERSASPNARESRWTLTTIEDREVIPSIELDVDR